MRLVVRTALKGDTFKARARIPRPYSKGIPEGRICRLTCDGRSTLVELRTKKDVDDAVIYIDAATRRLLGVESGIEAEFQIRTVGWIGEQIWAFRHADASVRIAVQLGAISLLLGLVSLAIALLPFAHLGLSFPFWPHTTTSGAGQTITFGGQATGVQSLLALGAIASPIIVFVGIVWSNLNTRKQISASVENARLQSKSSVVSSGRLRWIDAIREDVSEFLGLQLMYRHASDVVNAEGQDADNWRIKKSEAMRDMEIMHSRIELRLTKGKPKHDRLLASLAPIVTADPLEIRDYAAIEEVTESARDLFYSEWKRLRRELDRGMTDTTPSVPLE